MTKEHRSGYAILRAKVKEQQAEIERLQSEADKRANDLQQELDTTRRLTKAKMNADELTITELKDEVQRKVAIIATLNKNAASKQQEYGDELERLQSSLLNVRAREEWLYRRAPWVIKMWYKIHFGL